MLVYEMLKEHTYEFVYGYMTALSVIENPPNNGIDYKWCVKYMMKYRYKLDGKH